MHAMKAYKGSRGITPLILNLGSRCRSVVNVTIRPHYSGERAHCTHWPRSWMGPTAGLGCS